MLISNSLLFLFSTLAFIYYYHCHLAEVPAAGLTKQSSSSSKYHTREHTGNHRTEQHQMEAIPSPTYPRAPGTGSGEFRHGGSGVGNGYAGDNQTSQTNVTNGGHNEVPHPTMSPRHAGNGGYGVYQNGSNEGYGGV